MLIHITISTSAFSQTEAPDPIRFKKMIDNFEQWDLKNSYPEDAVLFVGSSSIRLWETADAFPDFPVINRGFGGSVIPDVLHFYEQTIDKYDPNIVVFYTGDNDIATGMSTEAVFSNYKKIVGRILNDHPDVLFIYIPIKPSSSRWDLWTKMKEVNQQVQKYNRQSDQLFYVDLATPLLAEDGKPDDSFFLDDRLHLNKKGYAVWNSILKPELKRLYPKTVSETR